MTPPPPRPPRDLENDGEDCKGLCVNCAYRDTCLLPRAEGGVWHCEKYAEDFDVRGEANGDERDRGMT